MLVGISLVFCFFFPRCLFTAVNSWWCAGAGGDEGAGDGRGRVDWMDLRQDLEPFSWSVGVGASWSWRLTRLERIWLLR